MENCNTTEARICKLNILDAKDEYELSMKYLNGFEITDSLNVIKKSPKSIRTENGIFSPKYGSTWGDDDAFADKYRCACGKFMSTCNDGRLCDECGTRVEYKDDDLDILGWLLMYDDNYIIHPILFSYIEGIIGKDPLDEILRGPSIDKNGNIIYEEEQTQNPYNRIGMRQFVKKFDEILSYFLKKKNNKSTKAKYALIMEHRAKVFIRHIPVYQFKMRPQKIDGDELFRDRINDDIQILQRNVLALRGMCDKQILSIESTLYKIQKEYNGICDSINKNIYNSNKTGTIRKYILGARMNYSARNVIVSYVDKKRSNEISLPYLTVLELYKPLIINVLTKSFNISYEKADCIIRKGKYRFDPQIYAVMMLLMKRSKLGLRVLINRNPGLSDGSIMCMKIVEIHKDIHDLTMAIPLRVLAKFNADFDGDVMNIYVIFDTSTKRDKIKVFDPKHVHYLSSNDGLYETRMNLTKSESIILGNLT